MREVGHGCRSHLSLQQRATPRESWSRRARARTPRALQVRGRGSCESETGIYSFLSTVGLPGTFGNGDVGMKHALVNYETRSGACLRFYRGIRSAIDSQFVIKDSFG